MAEVQSIGAGAVNQSLSRRLSQRKDILINDGIDTLVPEFVDVDIDGKVRTAIKFTIIPCGEERFLKRGRKGNRQAFLDAVLRYPFDFYQRITNFVKRACSFN